MHTRQAQQARALSCSTGLSDQRACLMVPPATCCQITACMHACAHTLGTVTGALPQRQMQTQLPLSLAQAKPSASAQSAWSTTPTARKCASYHASTGACRASRGHGLVRIMAEAFAHMPSAPVATPCSPVHCSNLQAVMGHELHGSPFHPPVLVLQMYCKCTANVL